MREDAFGERRQRVVLPAGVERVRHQHGVVVGRDFDAAQREHLPGEFQIVADLEHAHVGEQRLERIERRALGNLIGSDVAAEQAGALAALPMAERHVAGFVRRHRERKSAQLRLHRIEARGHHIDGDDTGVARALDPGLEPFDAAHGLIFRAVEFFRARGFGAGACQRLRRERAIGLLSSRPAQVGRLRRPPERKLRRRARPLTRRGPADLATLSRGGRG